MSLEPIIRARIERRASKLLDDGRLPSPETLDASYARFREKFGPDALRQLDGTTLLYRMHDFADRDASLVYWLEFKNDEDFPECFGSIAGGSALKYGLYRRRDNGAWMTGNAMKQRQVSEAEAVEIARRHRDQLVAGCSTLALFEATAVDRRDYGALQRQLSEMAPDVQDSAWGHKYFSLLFPEILDTIHALSYQRYQLVRMLLPPPEGEGRYLAAALFVDVARELDMRLVSLMSTLWDLHGAPYRYWRVGTSDGTESRNRWDMMRRENAVAVGWPKLGDLGGVVYEQASKDALKATMAEHYPKTATQVGRDASEVFSFCARIAENDLVAACDGQTVLGVGRITGPYRYEPSSDFPHRRPIEWLNFDEWPLKEGLRTRVFSLKKTPHLLEIERHVAGLRGGAAVGPGPDPPVPIPPPAAIDARCREIGRALERKGQVILHGPPGTGKTYWALRAARDHAAISTYSKVFSALTPVERADVLGDGARTGLVRSCAFHPAVGYEDFIEGFRPAERDGRLVFSLQPGLFKTLCRDAAARPKAAFVLLIDEINRGDVPRIFGELLTLLELDKRGESVILPLSGEPFRVPQNVFVLGTMNTADRSIALLDTALRRRFGFIELMPDNALLGDAAPLGVPLKAWLAALNTRLRECLGGEARNLQVGHSYFMHRDRPITDASLFRSVLREEILPLVQEYCYDDWERLEAVLGRGLVDSPVQKLRTGIFEPSRQDELIRALLDLDPGMTTTPDALAAAVEAGDDGEGDSAEVDPP